ncbi:hypothetical protein J1614_005021 [Plenodomus biglobosus]|nr:hypothetical protein J1614_005021 [Plenodomus biglobosus]
MAQDLRSLGWSDLRRHLRMARRRNLRRILDIEIDARYKTDQQVFDTYEITVLSVSLVKTHQLASFQNTS